MKHFECFILEASYHMEQLLSRIFLACVTHQLYIASLLHSRSSLVHVLIHEVILLSNLYRHEPEAN